MGLQTLSITDKKEENFSLWYKQIITKGKLLDYGDVSGCYIFLPRSYFIWEQIQAKMNESIRKLGVQNCYFPMFVSRAHLFREKTHVAGFEPEVAWITKCGTDDLKEPVAIRPTSETVMYPAYAKWIRSHQDLPLKYNQWNNVVRWEFKCPTPFLRSREFLWQEGHCVHATAQEALKEVQSDIIDIYQAVYKDVLAVYTIVGEKTEEERFPGADRTFTLECYIPDSGKGVQGATAHYLGQNFSKMFDIKYQNKDSETVNPYQNCWGFTTRSIGVGIMQHSDNKGVVLSPYAADVQIVIVPIIKTNKSNSVSNKEEVMNYTNAIFEELKSEFRVKVDTRTNVTPGFKFNEYEVLGTPLRIEIGGREVQENKAVVCTRHNLTKQIISADLKNSLKEKVKEIFEKMHSEMFENSKRKTLENIKEGKTWEDFMDIIKSRKIALMHSCNERACEIDVGEKSGTSNKHSKMDDVKDMENVSVKNDKEKEDEMELVGCAKTLCMPEQSKFVEGTKCFGCGKESKKAILYGRTY
eukprot:GAHX01001156.1.p1 GENE.GAHX01001156.1~~GAHX01001156.1.p1  ORF type:complete len:537 (-),score=111.89 GAHX01001156.1:29-1606(-)